MSRENYDWHWFLKNITIGANNNAIQWEEIIPFISRFDRIISQIVNREMSFFSKRPQDYIAATLSTNAFRTAISAFFLASAGYPDVAPRLNRGIWEISIRLSHMRIEPVKLAFAYMLNCKWNEIKALKAEISYRQNNNIDLLSFKRCLEMVEQKYDEIMKHTIAFSYNPDELSKSYRTLRLKDICKKLDEYYEIACFVKAYDVNYSVDSGYSHGHDEASCTFLKNDSNKFLQFNLGPIISDECLAAAMDVIANLSLVIGQAAELIEDAKLIKNCHILSDDIEKAFSVYRICQDESYQKS